MASFRHFPNGRWQAIVRRKGYRLQLDTFPSCSDTELLDTVDLASYSAHCRF